MARRAAAWLLAVARHQDGGLAWQEDAGRDLVSASLDNGAPGIAITLFDLGRVTHEPRYTQAATAAERWVAAVSRRDTNGIYWYENRHAGSWHIRADPSWHWGTAGIIDMAARLGGWRLDIPGEQPGFCYGSSIEKPSCDAIAANGLRYTNAHTLPAARPSGARIIQSA